MPSQIVLQLLSTQQGLLLVLLTRQCDVAPLFKFLSRTNHEPEMTNMLKSISTILLASALLVNPANAQDLTSADVVGLIKGKTAYLNLPGAGPRGTGAAVIFYADDNTAAAKFPNGSMPKGTWSIKGNEVCITWADQANNPCSTYVKAGDKINIMSGQPKQLRATIERLVAGNAEKL